MADWRQSILKHFKKDIRRLTLVSDPDGLLTEEQMLTEIKRRGFDLIPFEDSIAFRYAYESKYRSIWDRGEKTELVVVLRSESDGVGSTSGSVVPVPSFVAERSFRLLSRQAENGSVSPQSGHDRSRS